GPRRQAPSAARPAGATRRRSTRREPRNGRLAELARSAPRRRVAHQGGHRAAPSVVSLPSWPAQTRPRRSPLSPRPRSRGGGARGSARRLSALARHISGKRASALRRTDASPIALNNRLVSAGLYGYGNHAG